LEQAKGTSLKPISERSTLNVAAEIGKIREISKTRMRVANPSQSGKNAMEEDRIRLEGIRGRNLPRPQ